MCWITGRVLFEFLSKLSWLQSLHVYQEWSLNYDIMKPAGHLSKQHTTATAKENYHHQTSSSSRRRARRSECKNISFLEILVSREYEIDEKKF